ncbi:hypothetical protein HC251_07220 [Iamia sp. SCSIO 61187]|uniref:hypothetical protein n=1 Tax=Iamia sp. SCSIO 61187 TaxID=2722752 RepID=UPI001C63AE13|nr:hypothetical protein [Iamia sp. SCSIO 61187]QYG92247.1 hypothetical protein HC251_07220 [Iamia sp. SCSIO 61187]
MTLDPQVVPHATALDAVVAGAVRVRLVDATPGDQAAVIAQLGPLRPADAAPADITIRYVDRLPVPAGMRFIGPHELGVGEDGTLIVLRGRHRRPVRVRIPVADLGGPCELVCEHGVGRVPHLVAAINLALLRHDIVALHASAVEVDGRAVVATGWSKGGKTEVVLALLARGARLVGDEWLHLRPDGTVTGIREPVRVWDWQLDQLDAVRGAVGRRSRARLAAVRVAHRAVSSRSPRLATVLDRQRGVDVDGARLSSQRPASGPVPIGPVLLVTSADRGDIVVVPTTGHEVAERMVASLAYERAPLRELADAHRFAHPGTALPLLDGAADRERTLLHARLDDRPSVEVVHPYPVDLAHLGAVVADVAEGCR